MNMAFELPEPPTFSDNDAVFLKLFRSGFEMLTPHREQVCLLYIMSGHPKLPVHALRLLNVPTPFTHPYRLHIRCYFQIDSVGNQEIDPDVLESLIPADERMKNLFNLTAHIGLETLELLGSPNPLMHGQLLKLPSGITSITIPEDNLEEMLLLLKAVQHSLRMLAVCGNDEYNSRQAHSYDVSEVTEIITLPSLWSLILDNIEGSHVEPILCHLRCPHLEKVEFLSIGYGSVDKPQNSLPDAIGECKFLDHDLLTLELKQLRMDVDTLRCIDHIIGPLNELVLENLQVDRREVTSRTADGPELEDSFPLVFKHARPTVLEIKRMDAYSGLYFLKYTDLSSVEELLISGWSQVRIPKTLEGGTEFENVPFSEIKPVEFEAPLLSRLMFSRVDEEVRKLILRCLRDSRASQLEIIVTEDDEMFDSTTSMNRIFSANPCKS